MLQKQFLFNFNWSSICKFLFGIKKKFLTTYLNILLSKSYNNHFSDIFYDMIMLKINLHSIKIKRIGQNIISNSKFLLPFSNQVVNKININSIINDKLCLFPIKIFIFLAHLNIQKLLVGIFLIIILSVKVLLLSLHLLVIAMIHI